MKSFPLLLATILALVVGSWGVHAAPADGAAITRIAVVQQEVVVTVWVPAGVRRVTLESRPRLGQGAWTPRDVKWTEGNGGELTFKVPAATAAAELFRVREEAEAELALPASFFRGLKTFAPVTEVPSNRGFQTGGPTDAAMPGGVTFDLAPTTVATLNPEPARAVVESDIWKLDGRTLYFFNQQRGLQVIDVTDPDVPRLVGTLPLAVWGEQMYRLPADTGDGTVWLALLTQNGCDGNSEVLLVAVRDGVPALRQRLPLTGSLRESRLVGHALYVASYLWHQPPPEPDPNGAGLIYRAGEPRTTVTGLDLADPRHPVIRPALELAAMPNAISATDRWLFVATTGSRTPAPNERLPFWAVAGNNAVHVFDIGNPDGSVTSTGVLPTAGRVDSKFKLGLNGGVLTVVSEAGNTGRYVTQVDPRTGQTTEVWTWEPPRAELETFTLANPAAPERLAQLTLINNQSVYGTRFDGNRVYVVTFLRVDPLWIVDLSDPARPTVQGRLEVPGWSNFLQPLGDQLLAVGVEGGRAALSLFDVKNPASPGLLSKALLGEGWSWTEANNDEKALAVLPEAGLLLVPWSGTRPANVTGWFSGMQLVDYDRAAGTLRPRGVIEHSFQARRATVVGERVISLAGDALLAVDIADRDQPKVRAELKLTHQADRVFVAGDRLLQLAYALPPRVALTTLTAPETVIASFPLLSLPVVGAEVRGDQLYVLQHQPESYRYEEVRLTNQTVTGVPQPPREMRATNLVVELQEQPPLTNWVQVWRQIEFPPSPITPGYVTNVLRWHRELIPQPPLLVTNEVVTIEWLPQPPLLVTNVVVNTEWRSVPIPAESALSVLSWAGDRLELVGQSRTALPPEVWGNLTALWPAPDTLVWTEPAGGGFYPMWDAVAIPTGGAFRVIGAIGFDQPIGIFPGPSLWWPWWGGGGARHLVAFDVGEAVPRLAASVRLASTNGWSQFSAAFAAEGKVFVGERTTEVVTDPAPADPNGNVPVGNLWRHTHNLRVTDFTDAEAPVIRPPIEVPGELAGISHAGQLVYCRLNAQPAFGDEPGVPAQLQALAYDGVSASLVDSLKLPAAAGLPALLVRSNGQVLLGLPAPTTNSTPVLEAWAITTAGTFARQGSLASGATVEAFEAFDDVIVATAGANFLFLAATGPESLMLLGSGERSCSLWSSPATGDATAATGLWLSRGAYGVWRVPLVP